MSNLAAAKLPQYVRSTVVQRMLGGINRGALRELVSAGVIPPPAELNTRLHVYELDAVVEAVRKRVRKI
jgi:hypothetical protein